MPLFSKGGQAGGGRGVGLPARMTVKQSHFIALVMKTGAAAGRQSSEMKDRQLLSRVTVQPDAGLALSLLTALIVNL